MTMSEEARKAYENLDKAIEAVLRATDPELKTVLGDWAIVAAGHNFEEGQANRTTYSRLFRGGYVAYHVAIGLFGTGMELTQEDGAEDDD